MPRIQFFELEDLEWFPKVFRNYMTDYLQFFFSKFKLYNPIIPVLKEALSKSRRSCIIDLCSGGSGPILEIGKGLVENDSAIEIFLTDKYPNLDQFQCIEKQSEGRVRHIKKSVDAVNIPDEIYGFRTLFTALHHFPPHTAKKILEDAIDKTAPIAIFEITDKRIRTFLLVLLSPFLVLLCTPFIKPFQYKRLLLTYILPFIPLFVCFDGIVSIFRTYSHAELEKLISNLKANDYQWDIDYRSGLFGSRVTYIVGLPG